MNGYRLEKIPACQWLVNWGPPYNACGQPSTAILTRLDGSRLYLCRKHAAEVMEREHPEGTQ